MEVSSEQSESLEGAGYVGSFRGNSEIVLHVGNIEEYRQWTYQTKSGVTVLLANNGTTKALILADSEKSFITVNVLGNVQTSTFDVSDEMLEKMADSIDFPVIP